MNKIQTLLTTTVLLFGISGSSFADFDDGYDAYQKGDYKTAINEWKPLAEQGNASAQYNLGVMYKNGKGVLQDDKEAAKWLLKAAEQGYASAQGNLALMYESGKGVLKDDKRAIKWYRKAAEQGNAKAQYNLGRMLLDYGDGALKERKEAVKLLNKAADQGYAEAQLEVGGLYIYSDLFNLDGIVLKDLSKARYWIEKAYENPDAGAGTLKLLKMVWNKYELWKY